MHNLHPNPLHLLVFCFVHLIINGFSKSLKLLKEANIQEVIDLGINRKTAENIKDTMADYQVGAKTK